MRYWNLRLTSQGFVSKENAVSSNCQVTIQTSSRAVAGFDEDKYHVHIPHDLFREMVKRTVFATDSDSSRFALGGVLA